MKKEYSALRILIVALILVLVASMAMFSAFSWYQRSARVDETGYLLKYTQTGKVNNSSGVIVKTYLGTSDNGEITYSEDELSGAVDVKSGEVTYLKTVLTDTANAGGAVVSLYLKDFTYHSGMGDKVYVGIINPEKTYKDYSGETSGDNKVVSTLCLEDNITVPGNGTVEILWFVKSSDSDFAGTDALDIGTMCIAYN